MATSSARLRERKPAATARSAPRQKLAAAIAELARCRRAVETNERATSRAYEMILTCSGCLEEAKTAVAKAKTADAERTKAARSGAAPTASMMRKARAAEETAEDELAAARAAHAKLQTEQPRLQGDFKRAEYVHEQAVEASSPRWPRG